MIEILSSWVRVGAALKKELFDAIRFNFANIESRLSSLETNGGSVFIFNGDISLTGFDINNPDIYYYKAVNDFSINDFRAQIFSKQGITTGNLTLQLEKSIDTNNANFASVLTTALGFNFATDADYTEKNALINSSLNEVVTGNVLRVKITNKPDNFYGKILLSIGAQ